MTVKVKGEADKWHTTPEAWEASRVRWRHLLGSSAEKGSENAPGPQGFVVNYTDDYVLDAHFHEVPQFQVFHKGEAQLGKTELRPVTVYYSDEYTPYGPIRCGPSGLAYFNLRPAAAIGANYMPGSRERLVKRPGRHRVAYVEVTDPESSRSVNRSLLVGPEDDGLAAFEVVAGPGEELAGEVVGGSGRYELVLAGAVLVDGEELPAESILFTAPGERTANKVASAGGVHLLELQSPSFAS